jgi:hypothetical protein
MAFVGAGEMAPRAGGCKRQERLVILLPSWRVPLQLLPAAPLPELGYMVGWHGVHYFKLALFLLFSPLPVPLQRSSPFCCKRRQNGLAGGRQRRLGADLALRHGCRAAKTERADARRIRLGWTGGRTFVPFLFPATFPGGGVDG